MLTSNPTIGVVPRHLEFANSFTDNPGETYNRVAATERGVHDLLYSLRGGMLLSVTGPLAE